MVYDDYADIGIFAKWVMDAPEIGERAHPSVGRRIHVGTFALISSV